MAQKKPGEALPAEARKALRSVSQDLKALDRMNLKELQTKFLLLYGVETHSNNTAFLRKKLAWKLQELREGGLSDEAKARLEALMPKALPVKQPNGRLGALSQAEAPKSETDVLEAVLAPPALSQPRDPRLPATGTVLRRTVDEVVHEVQIEDDGFLYQGQRFKSLSAVAKAITGTAWNGFLFFGLKTRA